ncbi:malate dehydrogenase, NAD-dependent [Kwoniella shandongensis]|uniref:malate dehydrogenase n=1 Tax=Kwoniella shandongensis TaxID=1734106 RepID=A0AAJ8MYD8_9TREE
MVKAVVCGAAGGIGQPLSLLLKLNPLITELSLYDVVNAVGVATDLSHIATPAQVTGFLPADNGAEKALKDADIVVIPAGVPRKPGMTRDDLFVNAGICATLAQAIANAAPKAFILVISNPVNSTVPVFAETLKKAGVFDPKNHLDIVRASTFVATALGKPTDAPNYSIPVVGGHSGATILPLLSQSKPAIPELLNDKEKRDALINRIQFGGDEVVKAKDGAGSATLSMAQAGAEFTDFVLQAAFGGKKGKVVQSYVFLGADAGGEGVKKEIGSDLDYFSVNVELGPNGIEKILPIGSIDEAEKSLLSAAIAELGPSIEKGTTFQPAPPKL